MYVKQMKQLLEAATKREKSELVIKNITIIDVFQNDRFIGDVAIHKGKIVGIGTYEGVREIDGSGKYICPGLIDAHAHIESSLVTPMEYYKTALLHGITSIVADPHEIGNVMGAKGVELFIELSKGVPFDYYFMLPSCVPATNFEHSGANLTAELLEPLYKHKNVLGLAEVMNFPAVMNCDEDMLQKILDAKGRGLTVDGHGAGFDERQINTYLTAGINTDHECEHVDEVVNRLRRGMYVLMREGTVAKNLSHLIHVANIANSRRICLCTDDKHINDLVSTGSVDHGVRLAIKSGLRPETAIQMATLNTAECYKLESKGAVAPGMVADLVILDDLETFKIHSVYKNGICVVGKGELLENNPHLCTDSFENTINAPKLCTNDLDINTKDKTKLHIIEIIPNRLETKHVIEPLINKDKFESDVDSDLIKVAVIERHKNTGHIGLGVVRGLQLKEGAIATTIAHDSHNIIVCGSNDEDMIFAVEELKKMGGGIVVVRNGEVLGAIQLELAGLVTARSTQEVLVDLENLHHAVQTISPDIEFNPFLTLSFLSLPVIPKLKITDCGLFDVEKFEFINIAD